MVVCYFDSVDFRTDFFDVDMGGEGEPATTLKATLWRWLRDRGSLKTVVSTANLLNKTNRLISNILNCKYLKEKPIKKLKILFPALFKYLRCLKNFIYFN